MSEENLSCDEMPEEPYYSYISGVIEKGGKRYFQAGKLDEKCNFWSAPMRITKRRRIMLIELNSKMNPQQICNFLGEHEHYFEELQEKKKSF